MVKARGLAEANFEGIQRLSPGRKIRKRARAENYFEDELWVDFAPQDEFRYSRTAETTAREDASVTGEVRRKLSAPAEE